MRGKNPVDYNVAGVALVSNGDKAETATPDDDLGVTNGVFDNLLEGTK